MSVDIPTFQYKTRTADENDIYSYGFAFTSGDLDGAVKSLADVLPDMIRLAECEKASPAYGGGDREDEGGGEALHWGPAGEPKPEKKKNI